MKKPLLTTLGLAGACAACCAVPLLVPILSGLSVAGLAGLDWGRLATSPAYLATVLSIAVALALALGVWLVRRRRATRVCATSAAALAPAAEDGGPRRACAGSECGCTA